MRLVLEALDAKGDKEVSAQVDRIVDDFEKNRARRKRSVSLSDVHAFYSRKAKKADAMAGEVVASMSASRLVFGIEYNFDLHDALKDFAAEQRDLAEKVPTGGGPRNLYTMLYGPPEWRLYRDCFDLLLAEHKAKFDRHDFDALCSWVFEIATGEQPGRRGGKSESLPRLIREAYRVGRALKKGNEDIKEIHRQLRVPGISKREEKRLKAKLDAISKKFSKFRFIYPI